MNCIISGGTLQGAINNTIDGWRAFGYGGMPVPGQPICVGNTREVWPTMPGDWIIDAALGLYSDITYDNGQVAISVDARNPDGTKRINCNMASPTSAIQFINWLNSVPPFNPSIGWQATPTKNFHCDTRGF